MPSHVPTSLRHPSSSLVFDFASASWRSRASSEPRKCAVRDRETTGKRTRSRFFLTALVRLRLRVPKDKICFVVIDAMSKPVLQKLASQASGVSHEESLVAAQLRPTIYERLGGDEGVRLLSSLFYDRVFRDHDDDRSGGASWFLNIFSSSTKEEAIDNQYRFLVQTFGGPGLYREKKGKHTRLAGRHANYGIGPRAASRWTEIMVGALREHPALADDSEALHALENYFRYTAHYIVVTSEYMRPDQLSGGTKLDEGRVW